MAIYFLSALSLTKIKNMSPLYIKESTLFFLNPEYFSVDKRKLFLKIKCVDLSEILQDMD